MNRTLGNRLTQLKLKNNTVVYENFIKCTVKDYEYNYSSNPTLLSGSQGLLVPFSASNGGDVVYINQNTNYGILKDFATGSDFSPYVSTVGLYNDAGDLLAVAKMAVPMPLSANTDTTFLVKWDTQWTPRPYFTPTPSVTRTPKPTPSVTPSITVSPSVTPSVTVTPSITPTVTVTPSVTITPTVTSTPSITPSPSRCPQVTVNATINFIQYANKQYYFTVTTNAVLNNDIIISSAPVIGYEGSDCDPTEVVANDNLYWVIPKGVQYTAQSFILNGSNPIDCPLSFNGSLRGALNYKLNAITVRPPNYEPRTFTIVGSNPIFNETIGNLLTFDNELVFSTSGQTKSITGNCGTTNITITGFSNLCLTYICPPINFPIINPPSNPFLLSPNLNAPPTFEP